MLSRWRKEYREGIIVADKRKKVAGQSKAKKVLSKEQQLTVSVWLNTSNK
jgi:transposase